jgi:hypothetical protein
MYLSRGFIFHVTMTSVVPCLYDVEGDHALFSLEANTKGLGPLSPGAAIPTIHTQANPNPNSLNPNVPFGSNSVGIAAPGDSGLTIPRMYLSRGFIIHVTMLSV